MNKNVVIDDYQRERYIKHLREDMEPVVYVILDTFGAHREKISETMKYEVSFVFLKFKYFEYTHNR